MPNDIMNTLLVIAEQREKNPEIFRARISEKELKRGVLDPDNGNYKLDESQKDGAAERNAEKIRKLKEASQPDFEQWKNQVYSFAKRIYNVDAGFISADQLNFEWSQGTDPKEMVLAFGRKVGLEQIADPSEFQK